MDFNTLSSKIFAGETNINIIYNNINYNITVFDDEFLLQFNGENHYFDTINALYYSIPKN